MHFEYFLPLGTPRPGFSWSHSSWSDCSTDCGRGEGTPARGGTCPVYQAVPWSGMGLGWTGR